MKNSLSLIYVAVLLLVSPGCTKNLVTDAKTKEQLNDPALIVGKWELKQMVANIGSVNYPTGNGTLLEFTDSTYSTTDTDYSIFARQNHPKNGQYQIVSDTSAEISIGILIPPGQFSNRIILNKDTTGEKIFYQAIDNKLVVLSGYFPLDGGVQLTYEKR